LANPFEYILEIFLTVNVVPPLVAIGI